MTTMNHPSTLVESTPVAMGTHSGIDAAGMTNVGLSRPGNEDAFLIATLQRSLVVHAASAAQQNGGFGAALAGTLLMVADGMGGEGGGDVASRVAVNAVASYLLNVMPWAAAAGTPTAEAASGIRAQLVSAVVVGESSVKIAAQHSATPSMGTTLTMALVLWPTLYLVHVGDTRCYLLRAGQFSRLTTDHTVAQKILDEAVEQVAPDSHLHHLLWNSLGGSKSLPEPQIVELGLELGDRLLLCSDGLTKHVSDPEILAALSTGETNTAQCARLIELANLGGGSDNVTVLVATAQSVLNSGWTTHSA
jgi:serine/threonine protein phosphatase PrpC